MTVEIRYGHLAGRVSFDNHGNAVVHINDDLLERNIRELLSAPITELKPFRNLGIPGSIKVERTIASDEDIERVLLEHEEEFGYWVHTSGRNVNDNPWFGIKGFTLLKWNESDGYPWFVVEDNATGFQAFYHGALQGQTSMYYHWFATPITQSGLVNDWVDFGEEFERVEEIPYI
jgi:hypothetical protein